METAGGGWTLAMTVNPADGSSVAYNNYAFWVNHAEYGSFDTFASRDYKGPAAYTLEGDELMIQSVAFGEEDIQESDLAAEIKGWRVWPMLHTATIGSMFHKGASNNGGEKPCKTGPPSAILSDVGSTSNWDDIIRHGSGNSCIRTDACFGSSDDVTRLTTYDLRGSDDRSMSGFASCINCGDSARQECHDYTRLFNQGSCNGIDRAMCSNDGGEGCHHDEIANMDNPYNSHKEDCSDTRNNYCSGPSDRDGGAYFDNGRGHEQGWISRFFVREETPLTPAEIKRRADAIEHCNECDNPACCNPEHAIPGCIWYHNEDDQRCLAPSELDSSTPLYVAVNTRYNTPPFKNVPSEIHCGDGGDYSEHGPGCTVTDGQGYDSLRDWCRQHYYDFASVHCRAQVDKLYEAAPGNNDDIFGLQRNHDGQSDWSWTDGSPVDMDPMASDGYSWQGGYPRGGEECVRNGYSGSQNWYTEDCRHGFYSPNNEGDQGRIICETYYSPFSPDCQ
jgi:hypothetical protein